MVRCWQLRIFQINIFPHVTPQKHHISSNKMFALTWMENVMYQSLKSQHTGIFYSCVNHIIDIEVVLALNCLKCGGHMFCIWLIQRKKAIFYIYFTAVLLLWKELIILCFKCHYVSSCNIHMCVFTYTLILYWLQKIVTPELFLLPHLKTKWNFKTLGE